MEVIANLLDYYTISLMDAYFGVYRFIGTEMSANPNKEFDNLKS